MPIAFGSPEANKILEANKEEALAALHAGEERYIPCDECNGKGVCLMCNGEPDGDNCECAGTGECMYCEGAGNVHQVWMEGLTGWGWWYEW
jgi:RecJ-like exonuclease